MEDMEIKVRSISAFHVVLRAGEGDQRTGFGGIRNEAA
jgi:hypothetical protein